MKKCGDSVVKVVFVMLIIELCSGCSINKVEQIKEDWSFVVFGDMRGGYDIYEQLVNNMLTTEPIPEFAVCCGDIVSNSENFEQWFKFWEASETLTNEM